MKYPGMYGNARMLRVTVSVVTLTVFVVGLFLASQKVLHPDRSFNPKAPTSKPNSASNEPSVTIKLIGKDDLPLATVSVTFLLDCQATQNNCPSAKQYTTTTNEHGLIALANAVFRQNPTIVTSDYLATRYGSFPDPDKPNQFRLNNTIAGEKNIYEIDKEKQPIPIKLTPLNQ